MQPEHRLKPECELHNRSTGGRDFTSFVGIPYAKPPTGSLRFQKPQPVEPWTETKQATKYVVCSQVSFTLNFLKKTHTVTKIRRDTNF